MGQKETPRHHLARPPCRNYMEKLLPEASSTDSRNQIHSQSWLVTKWPGWAKLQEAGLLWGGEGGWKSTERELISLLRGERAALRNDG